MLVFCNRTAPTVVYTLSLHDALPICCGDLGGKGAREACVVDAGMAHMAVEVAVRALRQAERPMDIDAERRSVVAISALDRKSTRLNSSHLGISYAVFCLKKKRQKTYH